MTAIGAGMTLATLSAMRTGAAIGGAFIAPGAADCIPAGRACACCIVGIGGRALNAIATAVAVRTRT